jgi:hypothetical protein
MSDLSSSRVSSVSIVSGYGLDDRAIEVRSPAETTVFSSNLCVQTGSGAHPASCTMGTGGPFPGAKCSRGVTLTTHPHLAPRSRMSRSYTSSPPSATMACSGTALLLSDITGLIYSVRTIFVCFAFLICCLEGHKFAFVRIVLVSSFLFLRIKHFQHITAFHTITKYDGAKWLCLEAPKCLNPALLNYIR